MLLDVNHKLYSPDGTLFGDADILLRDVVIKLLRMAEKVNWHNY